MKRLNQKLTNAFFQMFVARIVEEENRLIDRKEVENHFKYCQGTKRINDSVSLKKVWEHLEPRQGKFFK